MTTMTTQSAGGVLREISPQELKAMMDAKRVTIIDVREPDEFARENIPGAVNMPLSSFDPAKVPADGQQTVVLHCQAGVRSAKAAGVLLSTGRAAATHLKGGMNAWKSADLSTALDRSKPISIMRQVQLIVGPLAIVGAVLGAFVNPWFFLLPAALGAGLTFAGATGTCALASLLGLMPWNRPRAAKPGVKPAASDKTNCSGGSCCCGS